MTSALLADKVALVTGAGQRIGREIARVPHTRAATLASPIAGTVLQARAGRWI